MQSLALPSRKAVLPGCVRYINHSCDPVMVAIGNEIEIAVRDIAAGDQLTCEYATLYPTAMMECRCGSSGCRGGVGLDDLAALLPELDRKGATALTSARSVPQPLLPFVRDAGRFLDWVDGRADRPNRHGRSTGVLRAERTG